MGKLDICLWAAVAGNTAVLLTGRLRVVAEWQKRSPNRACNLLPPTTERKGGGL
jgi:hypothetical protein